MAKKIQHSDIIQSGNPAIDTIKGLEQLDKGIKDLIGTLNKLKTELPKSFKGSGDVQKMASAQREAASATTRTTAAQREAQKAAAALEAQRRRGLAAMAKEEAKHREMIAAATGEARSLDQLQKKVTALIALRRQLDLSTEGGRKAEQRYTEQIKRSQDTLKRYDSAIGNHQRNVGNYKSALAGVREGLMKMTLAVTGAIMVFRQFSRIISSATAAYDKQATAERKLLVALNNRADVQQRLIRQAQQLQGVTTFGDEQTIEAAAQLAVMIGDNEEAISNLLPLIQDMASTLNMDLEQAAKLVAKTLGSSTNAMGRYGIEIEGAAGSSERMASMVENLSEKFAGMSQQLATEGLGPVKQMKNAWGDLTESIGQALLASTGFANSMTREMTALKTVLDDTEILSWWEKLNVLVGGRAARNAAAQAINDLRAQKDARDKLTETQKNANTETEKLTKNQQKLITSYNNAHEEVIPFTKASLKIAEAWKKAEAAAKDKRNAIDRLRDSISKLETQVNLAILTGKPFQKYINELVPKKQQIERMEALSKLFIDLAMGVDLFKDIKPEDVSIDIDLDFKFDEETAKRIGEDIDAMMQGVSDATAKGLMPKTLLEQLGMTPEDLDELKSAIKTVMGEFNKLFDARRKQADEALALAQTQTSQTIALLELEYNKRSQGLANNTDMLEKTLAQQQKSQEEALAMQQKVAAQQLRMQQIETAGAMIAAVAHTYKEWSKLGILGQIGAVVSIAAMMSGFASYQSQIKSMQFEKGGRFEEGERGVIQGDRHSAPSGGVPLSDQIKAEQGEKVYVLSRKDSQGRGGKVMDTVFDRIQAGDSDLLSNVTRLITPRIMVNTGSDRNFERLVKETQQTNAMLARWKFYNPKTGVETDLSGNKRIYN